MILSRVIADLLVVMLRPMRSSPSLDASAGVRLLTLVVVLTLLAVDVTQAQAVVPAPGFASGLKVVSGGLLWAGDSAGQEDVFLSTATSTRLLVPDAELSAVNVDDGWVVVAEASGPKVGRIGRGLRPVRDLHRCPPIRGYKEGARLEALTNGDLYAIVRASCLGRRPRHAQFLVRVQLGTGNLHVVGRVPSGAISLAAAGSRLALTYETGARPTDESPVGTRVRVEVLDARNGRLLYRLAPPLGSTWSFLVETQRVDRGRYRETQLDAKGDVLVISGFGLAPSSGFGRYGVIPSEAFGWWGAPRTRIDRPLETETVFGASLSEGRIAYVTSRESGPSIHVLNLRTGETRTIVTFSGSVMLGGFVVGRTGLAWAQQNYAYAIKPEDPPLVACVTEAPVGSPELIETPTSTMAPPIIVKATPGTRPVGPLCPQPR
jgi:hypothetical protein